MAISENMIEIYVPESLILGLRELTGLVLFDIDKLMIVGGFALVTGQMAPMVDSAASDLAG